MIPVIPPNLGWIQSKLDEEEIDYLWQCIDKKGIDMKPALVGQILSLIQI